MHQILTSYRSQVSWYDKLYRLSSYVIIGPSEADVRLQLAEDEATQAAMGVPSLHKVSASSFMVAALDLEDQQ